MNFALTLTAAGGASAVELLEALAIVLAVGIARGFRDALTGALAAAIAVLTLCLVLGPALRAGAEVSVLRVIVGGALLLFGLEWLRKGVLRVAGAGFALIQPLGRLPETQIKLGMGVALTAFGAYFTAEGLHAHWPVAELAPLYLAGLFAVTAWLAVRRLGRTSPAPEAT